MTAEKGQRENKSVLIAIGLAFITGGVVTCLAMMILPRGTSASSNSPPNNSVATEWDMLSNGFFVVSAKADFEGDYHLVLSLVQSKNKTIIIDDGEIWGDATKPISEIRIGGRVDDSTDHPTLYINAVEWKIQGGQGNQAREPTAILLNELSYEQFTRFTIQLAATDPQPSNARRIELFKISTPAQEDYYLLELVRKSELPAALNSSRE